MRYASFKKLISNFIKNNLLSKRQSPKQINITYVRYIYMTGKRSLEG